MNMSFSLMEVIIISVVCIFAELIKPLAFKVKIIKNAYPFIVLLLTEILTIIYGKCTNAILIDSILKGFVLGGISAWCYDAIIAKLKGFFK